MSSLDGQHGDIFLELTEYVYAGQRDAIVTSTACIVIFEEVTLDMRLRCLESEY
jgi:hypothetical protein